MQNVHHRYGDTPVLAGVDLAVQRGEIVCLLGASGSGKSTLLRIVAGLEPLQHGTVQFAGATLAQPGHEPPPEARNFGFVFQDHVLFPHMTIADNVAFGLRGLAPSDREARTEEHLAQVGLADFADRYPHTLSGGQQQRVALARALAPAPALMLLDEPFASVDATLRRRLREDTRRALRASGVPCIIVTHDAEEAMELADRIAVIRNGVIVQDDEPPAVWQAPVDRYVAELFSETDAIEGRGVDGMVETVFGPIAADDVPVEEGAAYAVIARPRGVHLSAAPEGPATIADVRFRGDGFLIVAEVAGQRLRAYSDQAPAFRAGARVNVAFAQEGIVVYRVENSSH